NVARPRGAPAPRRLPRMAPVGPAAGRPIPQALHIISIAYHLGSAILPSHDNLSFLLADVARLLRRTMARRLEGSELTFAQARVLVHLARDPGLRQVELAARLEVQPITLARLLDQ